MPSSPASKMTGQLQNATQNIPLIPDRSELKCGHRQRLRRTTNKQHYHCI